MKQQYNTIQAIEALSRDKHLVFLRVNDEKFELYRGKYGDIMMKIEHINRHFPVFNHMQDLWVLK